MARKEQADLVLEKYRAFAKARTLGFCVNIGHAEYMAEYFSKHGVPALAVHSGDPASPYAGDRREAVAALEKGEIKVIFAVDIFNEGVDIPTLDTVMFLRPTESLTVFLQQLGRGLRKAPGKSHLVVLDFIGNYKRAHWIPALLAGENPERAAASGRRVAELEYPEGCRVHFDFEVLDLFQQMAARTPWSSGCGTSSSAPGRTGTASDQAPDVYRDRPAFPGVPQRGLAAVSPFRGGADGRREGMAGDAGRGLPAGRLKDRFYKPISSRPCGRS